MIKFRPCICLFVNGQATRYTESLVDFSYFKLLVFFLDTGYFELLALSKQFADSSKLQKPEANSYMSKCNPPMNKLPGLKLLTWLPKKEVISTRKLVGVVQ